MSYSDIAEQLKEMWEGLSRIDISSHSGFIGAMIGALFMLIAAHRSHKYHLELERYKEEKLVNNVLRSIKTEINVINKRYQNTVGQHIEKIEDNSVLDIIAPMSDDYFSIYNCNAGLIGSVESEELRESIIKVYTTAKGILNGIVFNNKSLKDLWDLEKRFYEEGAGGISETAYKDQWRMCCEFCKSLKNLHFEFKGELSLVNHLIDEYVKRTEN